jgi:restriction endonuclease Mrr
MDGWEEAWRSTRSKERDSEAVEPTSTPAERIDDAISTLHADVRSRLMDAILAQAPAFFERLVLDVLLKMGYGGSRVVDPSNVEGSFQHFRLWCGPARFAPATALTRTSGTRT